MKINPCPAVFLYQLLVLVIRLIAKCSTKLKPLEINYLINRLSFRTGSTDSKSR